MTRREKWRHAFALGEDYKEVVTAEDEKLLDAFARAIVKRGMAAPALLWFISLRPMSFIGASIFQAAEFLFKDFALEIFIQKHLMPEFEHGAFVRAVEKRRGFDRLIELIEQHEAASQEEMRQARMERKRKRQEKG